MKTLDYQSPKDDASRKSYRPWAEPLLESLSFVVLILILASCFFVGFLPTIAALAGFLVLLPFVAGPILIYCQSRHPVQPDIAQTTPEALPSEAADFLSKQAEPFAGLGFEHRGIATITDPNGTIHITMWIHPHHRDMAAAFSLAALSNTRNTIAFDTRYADGTSIETNNMKDATALASDEKSQKLLVSWINEPKRLYDIHRRRVAAAKKSAAAVVPAPGQEVDTLRRETVATWEDQVRLGRFWRDGDFYRPTAWGAVIMTWGQIWPISAIRRWLRARRTAAVLRTLGVQP